MFLEHCFFIAARFLLFALSLIGSKQFSQMKGRIIITIFIIIIIIIIIITIIGE